MFSMIRTSLFALSTGLLFPAISLAHPVRWFNPATDGGYTLRICYQVSGLERATDGALKARLVYTGGEKLSRTSYTIPDSLETRVNPSRDEDLVYRAFVDGLHACEIVWEYGSYWVMSKDEVSGDR